MLKSLCFSCIFQCLTISAFAQNCPSSMQNFKDSCFRASTHETTMQVAKGKCSELGEILAVPADKETRIFIWNLTSKITWTGLEFSEGNNRFPYSYVSNSKDGPMFHPFFLRNRSVNVLNATKSRACVELGDGGQLRGAKCDATNWFVCSSCRPGTHGFGCAKSCPNCLNSTCNVWSGMCDSGCTPGYAISKTSGGCPCSVNCYGAGECNPVTGRCNEGCKPGFTSRDCTVLCPKGTYGLDCQLNCSQFCSKSRACNPRTGDCSFGCQAGYEPPTCQNTCDGRSYGQDCLLDCGDKCPGNYSCDHVTGTCTIRVRCAAGMYGEDCELKCGLCKGDAECHPLTGHCYEGCVVGYQPPLCTKLCPNHTFGIQCGERCSFFCAGDITCDPITGHCPEGCMPGFRPPTCKDYCERGKYGQNCFLKCFGCKENPHKGLPDCDPISGRCRNGCKSHKFQGDMCLVQQSTNDLAEPFHILGMTMFLACLLGVITLVLLSLLYKYKNANEVVVRSENTEGPPSSRNNEQVLRPPELEPSEETDSQGRPYVVGFRLLQSGSTELL